MAKINITLSNVYKKDIRIIAFLAGSWLLGLALIFVSTGKLPAEGWLLGAIPLINYIAYRIREELNKEGYIEAIRNK